MYIVIERGKCDFPHHAPHKIDFFFRSVSFVIFTDEAVNGEIRYNYGPIMDF